MKESAVKKKRGRKPKSDEEADPSQQIKILSVLTLYFATGSFNKVKKEFDVPSRTVYRWLNQYTDLIEKAKKKADDLTGIRLSRIIDLTLDRQIKNLEKKKDISLDTLNRIMGTAIDKLCLVQGKPTGRTEHIGKVDHNHILFERYIQIKEQAKKELDAESSNRIRKTD